MKNLYLIILMALLVACNTTKSNKNNSQSINLEKSNIKSSEIVVLKVNSEEVTCSGAHGDQKCLQIKELGVDKEWQNEYDNIKGFDFKPGFIYNLQVEKIELKEVPQDASSIIYKLIQVIKKEKPITNAMMSDYATLTVTKIQNGRDGYTATLKNDEGNLYVCTISIPNLEDNYVNLKVGDKVKIAGEYAEGNPVQISPKKIKVLESAAFKNLPELTVTKVTPGKDGETIHLTDKDKKTYNMIVSIPNLEDNYINLKVGDKVKVEGEYIDSFPTQILAKKIHKLNNE